MWCNWLKDVVCFVRSIWSSLFQRSIVYSKMVKINSPFKSNRQKRFQLKCLHAAYLNIPRDIVLKFNS